MAEKEVTAEGQLLKVGRKGVPLEEKHNEGVPLAPPPPLPADSVPLKVAEKLELPLRLPLPEALALRNAEKEAARVEEILELLLRDSPLLRETLGEALIPLLPVTDLVIARGVGVRIGVVVTSTDVPLAHTDAVALIVALPAPPLLAEMLTEALIRGEGETLGVAQCSGEEEGEPLELPQSDGVLEELAHRLIEREPLPVMHGVPEAEGQTDPVSVHDALRVTLTVEQLQALALGLPVPHNEALELAEAEELPRPPPALCDAAPLFEGEVHPLRAALVVSPMLCDGLPLLLMHALGASCVADVQPLTEQLPPTPLPVLRGETLTLRDAMLLALLLPLMLREGSKVVLGRGDKEAEGQGVVVGCSRVALPLREEDTQALGLGVPLALKVSLA